MEDIVVRTIGIVGPTGPGAVAPGSVITSRGGIIVGDASSDPTELAVGSDGTYLRSDGTDLLYATIAAGDLPAAIDAAKLADGSVSNTELQYIGALTSDAQTQLDGKSALGHVHLVAAERGVYADGHAQSTADTDNTSSTVTWANAMDYSMVFPTGHWSVVMVGGVKLIHSAAGVALGRVTIDGQDSTGRSTSALSATLYTEVVDDDAKSDCTGTVHMRVQFMASDAGTVHARNPWFIAIGSRVS